MLVEAEVCTSRAALPFCFFPHLPQQNHMGGFQTVATNIVSLSIVMAEIGIRKDFSVSCFLWNTNGFNVNLCAC